MIFLQSSSFFLISPIASCKIIFTSDISNFVNLLHTVVESFSGSISRFFYTFVGKRSINGNERIFISFIFY